MINAARLCIALLTMGASFFACGNVIKTPHVEAQLIARHETIQPGKSIEVALRLKLVDHWHTYWRNPGDSGLPTKLTWTLPAGFSAGEIRWPYPTKLPLGPLMNFGYEGEVLHLVDIAAPSNAAIGKPVSLKAKADWLVCNDVCIPESADLDLSLMVSDQPARESSQWAPAFAAAHAALPVEGKTQNVNARIDGSTLALTMNASAPLSGNITFYPYRDDVIANAGTQTPSQANGVLTLKIPLADPVNKDLKSLDGILVADNGWSHAEGARALALSVPVAYMKPSSASPASPAATSDLTLIPALVLAFVGGMILNLMPCVFPVLGIKVMGFVQHARSDPAVLRKQGLFFLGGVLVSFWFLAGLLIALRTAGQAVGWGFQLQSPVFVSLLAILFLLMALNLSGVFEMGLRLQSAAGNLEAQSPSNASAGAFMSGVLATIVATPCTAPFMGAALGFTLSQPSPVAMLVFTAIALGMSLPVTLLSFVPRWLSYLPRPGAWMETFKQLMAFPLFATVAWLVWVMGAQLGNDGAARLLFGLILIALAAWTYGRWQGVAPWRALAIAAVIAIGGTLLLWPDAAAQTNARQSSAENDWVPFSREKVAELRSQGKSVFVDFTATWCITCQVNKRVALNQTEVIEKFNKAGIVRMKADWTVQDPVITSVLAEFGRNGVPLYVFYPANGDPKVLPEVLSPSIVLAATGLQ
jgi:thiol:disulfide interchange protein DsbD